MILLTGASGFIGKHLLKALANKFGVDDILLLTSKNIEGFKCIIHNDYIFSEDFLEQNDLSSVHTVLHVGAFIPKSSSDLNNIHSCASNIHSTLELLEILPQTIEKFIFLSTVDVYEETILSINEDSKVNPSSLYGQSKLYCEKMLETWAKEKEIILQILRIGHIYGPGEETYSKILPISIHNVLNNIAPIIYSDGNEERSFLYIDDCCKFIIKSIDLTSYKGPINIVASESISVGALMWKIIEISGSGIKPLILDNGVLTKDYKFDNKKLVKLLGMPRVSIDAGLAEEIEYFRALDHG